MKKLILLSLLVICFQALISQNLTITKNSPILIDHQAFFPTFGNSSNQILYTGENSKGLYHYNLNTNTETFITDAPGAIHNALITSSGDIIFSNVKFVDGKRTVKQKKFNTSKGKFTSLESKDIPQISVKSKGKSILVSTQEKTEEIKPLGDLYYIWVSLSPDNSKLLFTVAGKGTYTSDLKGQNIQELGYVNAPVWLNNEWVVGMNDTDNGEIIISSDIIAVHTHSKKKINLTESDNKIEQYPFVSGDGTKIVYHTLSGEIYILEVEPTN
jgi:hypothetical protein